MTRIIAIGTVGDSLQMMDSLDGELRPVDELAYSVSYGPPGVLVGAHLFTRVAKLTQYYGEFESWTVQIRSQRRNIMRAGRPQIVVGHFLPIYFGFTNRYKDPDTGKFRRTGGKSRLFQCMDLADIVGVQSVNMQACLEYAQSVLSLCDARGVKFTGSRGGLAARLLKGSPQWEIGRQAAPEFVNRMARDRLPGNYYGLGVPKGENVKQAVYIDQTSAHHAVAASTPIPHPAHLRARGNHRLLEQGVRRPWVRQGEHLDRLFSEQYGLIACMISVGHINRARVHLYPPFMHSPGRKLAYLYTNERHYFDDSNATLEYAAAAWTSDVPDPALPEYATWALAQRNLAPGRKPLLLAAYGMLAQRTDDPTLNYYAAHAKGRPTILPGAGPMVEVERQRRPGQPQPSIVNVIARGMIEAETRARSLAVARDLDSRGIRVLSIYVDGLIVDTDRLPLLPEGWQVEKELTNVTFQNPSSFTSDQVSKQPGVPKGGQAGRMMKARRGGPAIRKRAVAARSRKMDE